MDTDDRGKALIEWRKAHGFRSTREFADRVHEDTGMSRTAVSQAEKGKASAGTYQRLDAWMAAWDHMVGEDEPTAPPQVEQIEFVIEGDFGVKVTVKGPITDRVELETSATNIIRSIRAGQPPRDD